MKCGILISFQGAISSTVEFFRPPSCKHKFLTADVGKEACMCKRSDETRSGTRTTRWRPCYKLFEVNARVHHPAGVRYFGKKDCGGAEDLLSKPL